MMEGRGEILYKEEHEHFKNVNPHKKVSALHSPVSEFYPVHSVVENSSP